MTEDAACKGELERRREGSGYRLYADSSTDQRNRRLRHAPRVAQIDDPVDGKPSLE